MIAMLLECDGEHMSRIKGWKKVFDERKVNTGGGIIYDIVLYRNLNNPLRQIELFSDKMDYDRASGVGVNIGTLDENVRDNYNLIQGEYSRIKHFSTLQKAKAYAYNYMRRNPNG